MGLQSSNSEIADLLQWRPPQFRAAGGYLIGVFLGNDLETFPDDDALDRLDLKYQNAERSGPD
jgi:hypothetical protein